MASAVGELTHRTRSCFSIRNGRCSNSFLLPMGAKHLENFPWFFLQTALLGELSPNPSTTAEVFSIGPSATSEVQTAKCSDDCSNTYTIFLNSQCWSLLDREGNSTFCHCILVVHSGPCCNMSSDTTLSRPHPLNRQRGGDQHTKHGK